VDSLTFGGQTADVSEGRFGDGANLRFFMPRSTPRGPNSIPSYNSPPRLPVVPDQLAVPDKTLDVVLAAADPDGNALTYTLDAAPVGSQILPTGVFHWAVPKDQTFGDYLVTVRVTDDGIPTRTATATFTVMVGWSPYASVIYSPANINGQATFTFTTVPGHTYRIEYADNLSAPIWVQTARDFVAANYSASITDFLSAPKRFYRVVWLE
jgi:hypothetical protein